LVFVQCNADDEHPIAYFIVARDADDSKKSKQAMNAMNARKCATDEAGTAAGVQG